MPFVTALKTLKFCNFGERSCPTAAKATNNNEFHVGRTSRDIAVGFVMYSTQQAKLNLSSTQSPAAEIVKLLSSHSKASIPLCIVNMVFAIVFNDLLAFCLFFPISCGAEILRSRLSVASTRIYIAEIKIDSIVNA